MQKVLSAAQIRAADQFTIDNEGISSIELMERASEAFVKKLLNHISVDRAITVLCGPGNNGGDGFAIARLLLNKGFQVSVHLIDLGGKLSPDCQTNLYRLETEIPIVHVRHVADVQLVPGIVIDAIFGSGLNRPVTGLAAEVIDLVNDAIEVDVVAVDMPSGLLPDEYLENSTILKAGLTICFQLPKLTFLIPESGRFVGEWKAVNIGLSSAFLSLQTSDYHLFDANAVSALLPGRAKFAHKGNYGRVQLIAGSLGKMGAAALCGEAIMRAGAGLLTIHVPRVGLNTIQTVLREAMATVDVCEAHVSDISLSLNTNVVCAGPGLGTHVQTAKAIEKLLSEVKVPMVLDADALNIMAQNPGLLKNVPKGSVLTPHLGEFERMFGKQADGLMRIEKIRKFTVTNQLNIVLKGAHSAVIDQQGQVFFNTTGNAGMATAGSGDVLAGIITGLMAQGLSGKHAAICGVFLHGLAGDLAQNKVGKLSLMASNLLLELPKAFINVTIASLF